MAKGIGGTPNRPVGQNIQKSRIQRQKAQQNRDLAHKAEMQDVTGDTATTLGKQLNKTEDDKKLDKAPKEKVTLTGPDVKAEQSEAEKAPQNSTDAIRDQKEDAAAAPEQPKSEGLKQQFLNDFTQNIDEDSMKEIHKRAGASLIELGNQGQEAQPEPVMAAHALNFAKSSLQKKMPGASIAEVRAAAKDNPEISKDLKILDSAQSYLKAVKQEQSQQAPAGNTQQATGDSSVGGPPPGGQTPGSSSNQGPLQADPFQTAAGINGQQDPSRPPGETGNPYHLSPEEQVQKMKEHNDMMRNIAETYHQMFLDNQKAMAQRHQLMMETNNAILDMFRSTHINRVRSADKHQANYLALLTGALG
jgi:hypothetical protein